MADMGTRLEGLRLEALRLSMVLGTSKISLGTPVGVSRSKPLFPTSTIISIVEL